MVGLILGGCPGFFLEELREITIVYIQGFWCLDSGLNPGPQPYEPKALSTPPLYTAAVAIC
jgi:hypothetical protein